MSTAQITETVAASAADVWRVMSDFGGVEPNEMIASCAVEGDGVGAVRTIALVGGGEIVERLESCDDAGRTFSYAIINECPLPVKNYLSTVRVSDDGAGGTRVDWSSSFEAHGAPEAEVIKLIEGVYRGGIARARSKLGL
jgi:hypothetical protein